MTVYEEAKGCQLLLDLGDTVAEVAEKTGFSESKIRRRVKLCELDEEAFKESQIRQPTLQDYDRLCNRRLQLCKSFRQMADLCCCRNPPCVSANGFGACIKAF